MNDLMTEQNAFAWVKDALRKFNDIQSFDDLERMFLRNKGLSACTYAAYSQAAKSIYTFLDGKHPLQWTASDIEAFYDDERMKNSIATASQKISGLKKLVVSIKAEIPFWQDPFTQMTEATRKKLATPPRPEQKSALYMDELRAVLAYLDADKTLKGLQNKAIILTLFTTGLRAQELCDLNWNSLEHDTDLDRWFISGVGKGRKPYKQEIHPDAVQAIRVAFLGELRSIPRDEKPVFTSLQSYPGKPAARLSKAVLWIRLRDIGDELKAAKVIRQGIEFSAHLFRRSYLTLLSRNGMSLRAIQGISRHSNIETLAKHYLDDTESPKEYLDKIMGAQTASEIMAVSA
jgi:integrase